MLLLEYADRPGVMGRVGTLLGEAAVNIEAAQISQTTDRADAIMLLRVDRPVDPGVLEPIGASVGATTVRPIPSTTELAAIPASRSREQAARRAGRARDGNRHNGPLGRVAGSPAVRRSRVTAAPTGCPEGATRDSVQWQPVRAARLARPTEKDTGNAPCGHSRRRHRAGGHRRGAEGPRGGLARRRDHEYDLGAARWHATGELLPSRCSPSCVSTTRSCSARSATRRCRAAFWNGGCCFASVSSSTTT